MTQDRGRNGRQTSDPSSVPLWVAVVRTRRDAVMKIHASTRRTLLAALAMVASIAAPAAAQDKVKVGVFPVSSTLPYFVAAERGFQGAEHRDRDGAADRRSAQCRRHDHQPG